MIYYDHTEGRKRTRLPENVRELGRQITGLERMTGADLLVTPLGSPELPQTLKSTAPHRSKLLRLCQAGALVQRATGKDLLSHIRNVEQIVVRMQEWESIPVLLSVGQYRRSKTGNVSVAQGAGKSQSSKWRYSSLQGALLAWQAAGGVYIPLCSSGAMLDWITGFEAWLKRRYNEPEKEIMVNLRPARPIIPHKETNEDGYPVGRAVQLLASLRGIGEKHALTLLETFGTAGVALSVLSSDQVLTERMLPRGIGKLTAKGVQEVLGGRVTVEGFFEPGFPVTVVFPPGLKVNVIGRKGVGWCKLEDGSTEATYFTGLQLSKAIPAEMGESAFQQMLDHVIPTRTWLEKRMVVINGEALVAVWDIKAGQWTCTVKGKLHRWNRETEKWENGDV
jgi:hypothetical protein